MWIADAARVRTLPRLERGIVVQMQALEGETAVRGALAAWTGDAGQSGPAGRDDVALEQHVAKGRDEAHPAGVVATHMPGAAVGIGALVPCSTMLCAGTMAALRTAGHGAEGQRGGGHQCRPLRTTGTAVMSPSTKPITKVQSSITYFPYEHV